MKKISSIVVIALWLVSAAAVSTVLAKSENAAMRVSQALWANGEIYNTVLTSATFKSPPLQSTDILYNFGMSGLEGQRGVTESAPGDRDYNGGRWNVKMVVFTDQGLMAHDPDGDGIVNFELTSADEVLAHEALGHIVINDANFYFECPLLRSR